MSIADEALWIIERNSGQQLTLNSIAAARGVSRSHLANAFGTASGWPVMKYLKARRLTEAARKLADGAPDQWSAKGRSCPKSVDVAGLTLCHIFNVFLAPRAHFR